MGQNAIHPFQYKAMQRTNYIWQFKIHFLACNFMFGIIK
uniref:Uncharacterized protein n=1 Tax=Aquilaria malaccensis TaxID=223753 RepID=A0A4Y6GNK1_9ROSI|nr:hypothetical protein [Aquilaria malaccensis]